MAKKNVTVFVSIAGFRVSFLSIMIFYGWDVFWKTQDLTSIRGFWGVISPKKIQMCEITQWFKSLSNILRYDLTNWNWAKKIAHLILGHAAVHYCEQNSFWDCDIIFLAKTSSSLLATLIKKQTQTWNSQQFELQKAPYGKHQGFSYWEFPWIPGPEVEPTWVNSWEARWIFGRCKVDNGLYPLVN